MHVKLTDWQVSGLREIHAVCLQLNTDFVIIGATAFQLYFLDENRFTADIDVVIALDLEQFAEFTQRLQNSGWSQNPRKEHSWHSKRGSYFDLLPAGPGLRAAKEIVWPRSKFAMSIVGFDHVFAKSERHSVEPGFSIRAWHS